MDISRFIVVGENIHCTRIFKVGGQYVREDEDGMYYISYRAGPETRRLPVPASFIESADWESGKVKHCAVAIRQGQCGDEAGKAAGAGYLQALARRQEAQDAAFLDVNVDEYSTDVGERVAVMQWTVKTVQQAVSLPISVDSSNLDILDAGLAACDPANGVPMVNSVSLEREDAIQVAAKHGAVVVASAAGAADLPQTTEARLENLDALMEKLKSAGFDDDAIHIDPLVFPISVDGANGTSFLEAVSAIRQKYGAGVHIVAGLSNISFGMPARKLINQVFSWMAVEAGADGGIVDPAHINADILSGMDPESEPVRMARALLLGEDEFGMEWITASREGRI